MPLPDLTSAETLRTHFGSYEAQPPTDGYRQWKEELSQFLQHVADTPPAQRHTVEFQRLLWEENKVSSTGRGTIPVDRVIANHDFREWLAAMSVAPLPQPDAAVAYFEALYQEIVARIRPYCRKIPHLKIFRVLAALFPDSFTTISDRSRMEDLHQAMFGAKGGSAVARHINVVQRFTVALGPPPPGLAHRVSRMTFAWYLSELTGPTEGDADRPTEPGPPGAERLVPLPAQRRRRGLTALRGYMATVMSALEFVKDGVTRDDLLTYLRTQHPDLKETSLGVVINGLQGELHVIRREGERYVLTRIGEELIESDDPGVLAPWLITRVLGIDHVLMALRDHGEHTRGDLIRRIRPVNPRWTSDWMPGSMLSWLRSVGLIEITADGRVHLTESGRHWAQRIHWTPESLSLDEPEGFEPAPEGSVHSVIPAQESLTLPAFDDLYRSIDPGARFDRDLVAKLHAGLWAHARRHFAILSGLSGSGKTLLAVEYGKAVTGHADRVCVVAVQPGWTDATAMLGYVNPLRADTYVRTRFVDFLVESAGNQASPYVVVLDEMNLSHPEQYLAPLLSAMETGRHVELHQEGDVFDGVPARVAYPANVAFIGTVNMDETTHGLSDKILDRAFTLEFWRIDVDHYPRWGARGLSADVETAVRAALKSFGAALEPARLHFGWRVIDDVLQFVARATKEGGGLPSSVALDAALYAKVLPKLRGEDSPRFRKALESAHAAAGFHGAPECAARIAELLHDLQATGTARFWR